MHISNNFCNFAYREIRRVKPLKQKGMKLEKLVSQCIEALNEEAGRDYSYWYDEDPFGVCISTENGSIDLFYKNGTVEVQVIHDYEDNVNHPRYGVTSTNLEKFLTDALLDCVDWDVIKEKWRDDDMDEFQRNGFDSEADFWRWKEG